MNKLWLVASCFSFFLASQVIGSLRGQEDAPHRTDSSSSKEKASFAVNLVRAIDTAEGNYRAAHGAYASWGALATSDEFAAARKWAATNDPQIANPALSKGADILPGWSVRLTLSEGGKSFDVLLEDKTDQSCGYAVLSDERNLIRQGKTIDCPI